MKKQALKLIIIVSIFGFALYSCKKEKIGILNTNNASIDGDTCTCGNLPIIPGYNTGYNYFHESNSPSFPVFNPNDDNEILFVNFKSINGKELTKYNLVTKEKKILFTGTIFGKPTWSKLGWIVFDNGYNGLYKVRPDGSELTLFITGGDKFNPKFNEEGDKLLTYHAFTNQGQYAGKIWDIDGQLLDSLDYNVNLDSDWKRQSNIGFRGNDKIFIVNSETKQIIKTHETFLGDSHQNYSHGFAWINENEAILEQGFDVKKLNVWTGELTKLFCGCEDRMYKSFSMNGVGTKAIFNKIIYKVKEEGNPHNILVFNRMAIYDFEKDTVLDINIEF